MRVSAAEFNWVLQRPRDLKREKKSIFLIYKYKWRPPKSKRQKYLWLCYLLTTFQVVQSLRNEIEDFITGEDYELTKDVFFMLKLPFDVEADRSRLQQILNRRKRKIGLSQSGSRGGRILNPQNILQVINEP